jgi:competence protein ComEA
MRADKIFLMAKKEESKKDERLEKLKYIGLGALVVAILGGSFVLFWQINRQNSTQSDPYKDANSMQSQVSDLNKKIEDLNKALDDAKSSSSSTTVKTTTQKGTVAGASTDVSGQVNLNTASASELDSLSGIGTTYAQRIIEYRESSGGFKSIEEIENVKGIGPATFEKIKDQITI